MEDLNKLEEDWMYHYLMACMYNDRVNQIGFLDTDYVELINLLRCHTVACDNIEHILELYYELTDNNYRGWD